jgi:hypothetical protein
LPITAGGKPRQGVPLYTIAEGEATHDQNLRKLLDELSELTGGAAWEVKKPGEMEQVFHKISRRCPALIHDQLPATRGSE